MIGGLLLIDDIDVLEGYYEEESMKSIIVFNCNMILFLLVVGYVVFLKVSKVYYGVYLGDYVIYFDCCFEFV